MVYKSIYLSIGDTERELGALPDSLSSTKQKILVKF